VVLDEGELREAAAVIFNEFNQPVLVEQYIEGREVNVGLLGNAPPEAFPPVELLFGQGGPNIYTLEDKKGLSGREISHACPAPIGEELLQRAKEMAVRAFSAIGCSDCARVDMRLDDTGNLYILEINSLPSLGEHGSYLVGAQELGLDFGAVINRLVQAASARYFGTPDPPQIDPQSAETKDRIASYVTQRRDAIENRIQKWVGTSSHTTDPVGIKEAVQQLGRTMADLRLSPVKEYTDARAVWMWQTARGFEDGTLLVGHLDVPVQMETPHQTFRREPERLYGEGIGSSRAPLAMMEYAIRGLRNMRLLRHLRLGVLYYTDEGREARYSGEIIREAASRARQMLILRPGNPGGYLVTLRRGQRVYRFRVQGTPHRPGRAVTLPDVLRWTCAQVDALTKLTSRKERVSVSAIDISSEKLPMLLPHRVTATLLVTYPEEKIATEIETQIRATLGKKKSDPKWTLELVSDRPPMRERRANLSLARNLEAVAETWEVPLRHQSSVWPSVAGLSPAKTATVCGLGPPARDLGTPSESVERIGLIQRTLVLAEFLAKLATEEASDARKTRPKKR
jgi:D-alanine-D-alanine ligase